MSAFAPLDVQLTHPAVRDLAWAIASPGLLAADHPHAAAVVPDAFCAKEVAELSQLLHSLDRDPAPLTKWLESHHSHRLGEYFERLVAFWLTHAGAQELRVGFAVRDAGRVLGEFDLLFRHPKLGGLVHWEVAVKFYLLMEPAAGLKGFLGPDCADRLVDKLDHLFGHQLLLAHTPAGRAALGGAQPRAQALVKGWLFFPLDASRPRLPELSPAAPSGWWLRYGTRELPRPAEGERRWKVLPRLQWLAPALGQEGERTLFEGDHLEHVLATHFARARTPLLVARLAPVANGLWREDSRGFVVSPDWPSAPP
ncbi:DUF1853 family protein [Thiobacter aerophilum]|uniref:DUF1853 family protein n=1 Tax=Thiobacter aerophilum TaxID=3121275 RepID=A0ABV0ECC9_9BURK